MPRAACGMEGRVAERLRGALGPFGFEVHAFKVLTSGGPRGDAARGDVSQSDVTVPGLGVREGGGSRGRRWLPGRLRGAVPGRGWRRTRLQPRPGRRRRRDEPPRSWRGRQQAALPARASAAAAPPRGARSAMERSGCGAGGRAAGRAGSAPEGACCSAG